MSDSEDEVPLKQRRRIASKTKASSAVNGSSAKASTGKAPQSDSEDNTPLSKKVAKADNGPSNGAAVEKKVAGKRNKKEDSDSDSDVPLAKKIKKTSKAASAPASDNPGVKRKRRSIAADADDDEDDGKPSVKKASRKEPAKKVAATKKVAVKSEMGDDAPAVQSTGKKAPAKRTTKGKSEPTKDKVPAKRGAKTKVNQDETKGEDEDEEDDEEYKWWLDEPDEVRKEDYAPVADETEDTPSKRDTVKWRTLVHQGVAFPPPYVPHGVKMKYDGNEIELSPEAEEVATFYAQMLETEYIAGGDTEDLQERSKVFKSNFFADWRVILNNTMPNHPIRRLDKCDFTPIAEHVENLREMKKTMTKEEKEKIKADKKAIQDIYGWAYIDGRKEKVGNFSVEPPGLFRGRGKHPKSGKLKKRVTPEDVTLNFHSDDGTKPPTPPEGHEWAGIECDTKKTWLAKWTENINKTSKYVFLAANSTFKGKSDRDKFQTARALKFYIDDIRAQYEEELKNKTMEIRQRATCVYLIDKYALRAGNEKDAVEEADTAGCCSLKTNHVELAEEPDGTRLITFDFLGKDSIQYNRTIRSDEVEKIGTERDVVNFAQVWKNFVIFKKNKKPKTEKDLPTGEERIIMPDIFDRVTTSLLNRHLASFMRHLTAKVFRTYNASTCMQEQLRILTREEDSIPEKLLSYQRANRQVAILCNHQRAVPKSHSTSMAKLQDKIRGLKYERSLVKKEMLQLGGKKLVKQIPDVAEADQLITIDDQIIVDQMPTINTGEPEERKICEADTEEWAEWVKIVPNLIKKATEEWVDQYKVKQEELQEQKRLKKEEGAKVKEEVKEEDETKHKRSRKAEVKEEEDEVKRKRSVKSETPKPVDAEKRLVQLEKKLISLNSRIKSLEVQHVDKNENKTTALGTSKINYIDPRISVAWCKRFEVPVERVLSKTLRDKFKWAMDVDENWEF
ncbi:eukaryotic DNA topoisomerase I [Gaertneriomyces semiglobifer]|nr:eukaryotic DNA topoisomerase I [Gaertneriomyces semiglobifer]